jgi:aryl-alcohol dehydrogenase-like predicted oxidoreductase
MESRRIGVHEVPIIGTGTSKTFEVDDDELALRAAMVDTALDLGATLFDSSPMYRQAEHVLCEALATRRPEALIATKVWSADDEEAERQIAASLNYFGGHVELFQIHNLVGWPKRVEQLERQKAQGTIDEIGATHWQAGAFDELEKVMKTGRITFVQIPYNPMEREVEARILPVAADMNLGVLIMRPFAKAGLFRTVPTAEQLQPLAQFGVTTWSQALLVWGLSDPRTSASIPATSKLARVSENIAAGSAKLFDDETRDYVARLATS